jgi:hypothetical protein
MKAKGITYLLLGELRVLNDRSNPKPDQTALCYSVQCREGKADTSLARLDFARKTMAVKEAQNLEKWREEVSWWLSKSGKREYLTYPR